MFCRMTGLSARERLACKSIPKARLRTAVDVADVRREVAIMASLPEHPALVRMRAAYEDDDAVHILMELCDGGELFDRIVADGTRSAPRPGSWRRSCARCRGGQDERQRRGVGDAIAQVGHSERQEQGGHDVVVHLDVAATGRATRMAPRASSGWSARRASAFMSPLCKSPSQDIIQIAEIWGFRELRHMKQAMN